MTIPSLCAYLLVEQETAAVVVFRRTDHGFVREVHQGLDAVIPLREIDIELPLAEVATRRPQRLQNRRLRSSQLSCVARSRPEGPSDPW